MYLHRVFLGTLDAMDFDVSRQIVLIELYESDFFSSMHRIGNQN